MEAEHFDVIICGGGPAGSTCAMSFKDTGLKIGVLDKNRFPREKVCGDGVAAYIPKSLGMISPAFQKSFQDFDKKIHINNILVSVPGKREGIFAFPEPWYLASRYDFDFFLFEQAKSLSNITFIEDEQVTGVTTGAEKAMVTTASGKTFTCGLVVGCDGATSLVRRELTTHVLKPEDRVAAIRAYFSGVQGVKDDTFEFHFMEKFNSGYFWIFPGLNGDVNVGFGLMADTIQKKNMNLREEFMKIIKEHPSLKKRFEGAEMKGTIGGWSIPLGFQKHPISGNRFMLAGDAASIADPASGEGIGLAMISGRIAGFHAAKCFRQNDFSAGFMLGYDRDMEKKFGPLLRKRKRAADLFSTFPGIISFTLRILTGPKWISRPFANFIRKTM